jgi:hypothetical protein
MLIPLTLAGCSARIPLAEPERIGCELDLNAECAHAIEHYTAAGETVQSNQGESPNPAHLVPLDVPIALPRAPLSLERPRTQGRENAQRKAARRLLGALKSALM